VFHAQRGGNLRPLGRRGCQFLGRCGTETEPDGVVCTGDMYAKLGDPQAQCTECGGWEGVLAPGRRQYTENAAAGRMHDGQLGITDASG
jgi:hypothetical protein